MLKFFLSLLMLLLCQMNAEEQLRASSAPFLSGDTFRSFADHLFDETVQLFNPASVQHGDIIFVKGDMLGRFFADKHPQIRNPYVLISHNSDELIPGRFASFLDDAKILEWFAENAESDTHLKLTNLPRGLANRCWLHGSPDAFYKIRAKIPEIARDRLLYLSSAVNGRDRDRAAVHALFHGRSFCYSPPQKPFEEYLKDLASCKFVLCPTKQGMDCHTAWEALYMGAIPIVKTSSLDPLYADLPILVVRDWSEVTEEFLESSYQEMIERRYNNQKLEAFYWVEQFNTYKKKKPTCVPLPFNPTQKLEIRFPQEPLDVVIPCVEKDLEVLPACIQGIKKYCQNVRKIYVASSRPLTNEAEWIDESLYPFSKYDIALALTKSDGGAREYMANKNNRCGWFFQQLLKVYASFVIPDISPNLLVVDADLVFLRPVHFQDEKGAPYFNVALEYHLPYFDHFHRLLPGLTRVLPKHSGITHHMLFQRPILKELFHTVETLHGKEFWKAFCEEVAPEQIWVSGASEYEIYFNYALTLCPEAKVRPLKGQDAFSLNEPRRSRDYDYITYHSYNRN